MLLFEQFQHPNGQIPAYEWEFSDLNPPVHAWAVWRVYNMDRAAHRQGRPRCFWNAASTSCCINFAWWVNKVDSQGNNIFEGGFLGLDNITVVDRSVQVRRRRGAGAVRRHRLDGHVLPEHDADRPGAGQGEPRLRRPGHQVLPALRLRRRGHEAHGRPRLPALGRTRRLLLRRAPLSRRPLPQVPRPLAGRAIPLFAVERLEMELDQAVQGVHGLPRLVPAQPPRADRATSCTPSNSGRHRSRTS